VVIKIYQFGTILFDVFTSYNGHLLITTIIFGIYVAVHFFGLTVSIRESPCGLKAFSVQQLIFFVIHMIGFILLIVGSFHLFFTPEPQPSMEDPSSVKTIGTSKPFEEGQNILNATTSTHTAVGSFLSSVPIWVCIGLSVTTTLLDLITAVLARRGWKQLLQNQAVMTLTDLSETPDQEMGMTPINHNNMVPLNVVYVPANLYDPLQTYQ